MSNKISDQDRFFIQTAINIAKKNIGIIGENPSVGSILVKNGVIISTGITAKNGGKHSEFVAILNAKNKGADVAGAVLYVSLEPCCHFGKNPPCVDLIIQSKISKVVFAVIDPDQRVNGGGIKKLQDAKIEVVFGILQDQARIANLGFFLTKEQARPLITLKLATSLDGKIATKNGDSKWISGDKARQYSHYLRAKNDAILIGSNTLKADDPMLNCRLSGLQGRSPKRIIVSASLNIDLKSKIIQSAKEIPTYICTNNPNTEQFNQFGVKIIHFPSEKTLIGVVELAKAINKIAVNNLLIEGGASIAAQFLKNNLVDRLIWIRSPKIIGGDGISGVAGFDLLEICQSLKFKNSSFRLIGEDLVSCFDRQN